MAKRLIFLIVMSINVGFSQFNIKNYHDLSDEYKDKSLIDSNKKYIRLPYNEGELKIKNTLDFSSQQKDSSAIAISLKHLCQFYGIHRKTDSLIKYKQIIDKTYFQYLPCRQQYFYRCNISYYYYNSSKFDKSMKLTKEAIELADKCKFSPSDAYQILIGLYRLSGDIQTAKNTLLKHSQELLNQEIVDSVDVHYAYNNLSILYADLGQLDSAIFFVNESLNYKEGFDSYVFLLDAYIKTNKSRFKIDSLFSVINEKAKTTIARPIELLNYYFISSEYYISIKDSIKAKRYANKAINLSVERNENFNIYKAYLLLIKVEMNENFNLVDSLTKYQQLNLSKEAATEIRELKVKYDLQEKEKSISILNTKVKEGEIQALKIRSYIIYGIIAVVLGLFLFLFLLKKRREKTLKRIEDLRNKALKAQMNPHFFFNVLNSINNFIVKNDKEKAQKFLTSFSKLMRLTLENSQEEYITIEQEKNFLEHYLLLEQLRTKNFDFKIEVESHINETLIPSFLIQPLVENSIIHGFRNINYRGELTINFTKQHNKIKILVKDNGVGKDQSVVVNKTHKSFATKILKDRIKIYQGKVIDNSLPNKGTSIAIILPIKE